jgi:hypothetical protein
MEYKMSKWIIGWSKIIREEDVHKIDIEQQATGRWVSSVYDKDDNFICMLCSSQSRDTLVKELNQILNGVDTCLIQ